MFLHQNHHYGIINLKAFLGVMCMSYVIIGTRVTPHVTAALAIVVCVRGRVVSKGEIVQCYVLTAIKCVFHPCFDRHKNTHVSR